jgi:hypothetical protein
MRRKGTIGRGQPPKTLLGRKRRADVVIECRECAPRELRESGAEWSTGASGREGGCKGGRGARAAAGGVRGGAHQGGVQGEVHAWKVCVRCGPWLRRGWHGQRERRTLGLLPRARVPQQHGNRARLRPLSHACARVRSLTTLPRSLASTPVDGDLVDIATGKKHAQKLYNSGRVGIAGAT